ncbi:MAG: hypothetical protein KC657_30555 [Myxococcales bacterium]|nr:hypothetical protein [Myxococcales bacterium]
MKRPEVELLEDDLDDIPTYASSELGLPIDLAREDLDDEDDLGLRALYEHPEAILGSPRWSHAA